MTSSKKCVPGSMSPATLSRAVSRFFLCCDSMALAPPPWRIVSSSFLMVVRSSTMRWEFFSKSGDFVLMAVSRTDEDTRRPRRGEWQQRNQYTEGWRNVRAGEQKRKDNAEALSSLRCAEEDGLTTEDTEGS